MAKTYAEHLASTADDVEDEEEALIDAHTEMAKSGRVGWYRNPARSSQDSLGILYDGDLAFGILRPDFVFFGQSNEGGVLADIVDPHGHHFADSLPKLIGLADYAEKHGHLFGCSRARIFLLMSYFVSGTYRQRIRHHVVIEIGHQIARAIHPDRHLTEIKFQ